MMRVVFPFILLLCASQAHAEYRVFLLAITNMQTTQTRTVTSTLDNLQYPSYYPLRGFESIKLVDTWMCWGHHGEGVPYCPNPRGQDTGSSTTQPSTSSANPQPPASPPL